MTSGFDLGILVLVLGAIALVAGLGAVAWEKLQKVKVPNPDADRDLGGPIHDQSVSAKHPNPATEIPPPISIVSNPSPQIAISALPAAAHTTELHARISTKESAPEVFTPMELPLELPPFPVEEFKLEAETVSKDETYAESLQEKVEADDPSQSIETEELPQEADDESFLTCSGNATWTSPENDRDTASINRAIFRNSFNSLIFSFGGFSSHDWPLEIVCSRETAKSYTGTAKHGQISVHCVLNFRALQGSNLEFDGWWQTERHDGRRHLRYRFSGLLRASRQFPGLPPAPAPVPAGPRVTLPAEPYVPGEISIPIRRFSLGYGEYRGNPFIEILENGRPWGETHRNAKKHFSFGRRKARMILLAAQQIREFVTSDGEGPATSPASVQGGSLLDDTVEITKEDSFNIGTRRLPFPHLKLTHKEESLGFGLSKADALLSLWPKIEEWAKRN